VSKLFSTVFVSWIVIFAVACCLLGCQGEINDFGKQDNVSKVVMHDTNDYSIVYQSSDNIVATRRFKGVTNNGTFIVRADVPKGEPMWVSWEGHKHQNGNMSWYSRVEIHVHSTDDINGPAGPQPKSE
jgi:hypothetical protein